MRRAAGLMRRQGDPFHDAVADVLDTVADHSPLDEVYLKVADAYLADPGPVPEVTA